jgi:hypothetical protein
MLDYILIYCIVPYGLCCVYVFHVLAYIYRPLMYSICVIQYISFLSTWYQSTGSESPIYLIFFFFLPASSQQFSGAAVASAVSHRSVFLGSTSSSPCFDLVYIPIETLGDHRARAVKNSPIGAFTLLQAPPEDSAAARLCCRSAARRSSRSIAPISAQIHRSAA